MDISVEKTPKQKLSQYVIDTATAVSITHLPGTDLSIVKDACVSLNEQAGKAKAVAHIGARNITSEKELHESCIAMRKAGIDKVLVIGGSTYYGKIFQNADEVRNAIEAYNFKTYCGLYPQHESIHQAVAKFQIYDEGITQLCLNPRLLNSWHKNARIGVPSNCTIKGLYKYMRLCGLTESLAYALGNLSGIRYVGQQGFNTKKFVKALTTSRIHIYNFGKLDQTLLQLEMM